jgi:hypothetical protein
VDHRGSYAMRRLTSSRYGLFHMTRKHGQIVAMPTRTAPGAKRDFTVTMKQSSCDMSDRPIPEGASRDGWPHCRGRSPYRQRLPMAGLVRHAPAPRTVMSGSPGPVL